MPRMAVVTAQTESVLTVGRPVSRTTAPGVPDSVTQMGRRSAPYFVNRSRKYLIEPYMLSGLL